MNPALRPNANPEERSKPQGSAAAPLQSSLPHDIDLKQIRCFVAAYEEGSFSKAAQREHCTQPGLSVYIQRLESLFSHRLFDRQARGVTPTIAGRRFYGYCTDVLRTVGIARQQMQEMAGSFATQINVGVPPTLFKGVVHRMLPDYLAAHPFVDVRLAEAYRHPYRMGRIRRSGSRHCHTSSASSGIGVSSFFSRPAGSCLTRRAGCMQKAACTAARRPRT